MISQQNQLFINIESKNLFIRAIRNVTQQGIKQNYHRQLKLNVNQFYNYMLQEFLTKMKNKKLEKDLKHQQSQDLPDIFQSDIDEFIDVKIQEISEQLKGKRGRPIKNSKQQQKLAQWVNNQNRKIFQLRQLQIKLNNFLLNCQKKKYRKFSLLELYKILKRNHIFGVKITNKNKQITIQQTNKFYYDPATTILKQQLCYYQTPPQYQQQKDEINHILDL